MLKVVVIGLGRFGATVAVDLCRRGAEVLAVDRNMRLVEEVNDRVTVAVGFDATDRVNLEAYDVGSMDVAVIAIGTNFEASVLVTMHCKALGVKTVYAKALNSMQAAVLERVGADHVVRPEEDMGARLAESLVMEKAVEFVDLPTGYSLRRLTVPGGLGRAQPGRPAAAGRRAPGHRPGGAPGRRRRASAPRRRCPTARRSCTPATRSMPSARTGSSTSSPRRPAIPGEKKDLRTAGAGITLVPQEVSG